ncbi:hypothetical protein GLOTRDRAFT_48170 [Gloeophyllum trabeum ATCC 11539]|uniref:Uncharacterized protein n=1 Tax=Gloeophyllum trabeum (strain ATCC 11539 / FP-39264 / Madison 617) TaxID=670483 RepID=S7PW96_GLOTA|nr:uncharacterized protein GLOTRDRAFT_48170 [Gloeophyllum trabeum ATCC 11539]EPQ51896.1 hypothetical protein GLOTRDRAFT_48170 [Gloeophyllum trabeum ATCC 11539]
MGLDETVHFAIDGSDPSAEAAWRTTIWYPPGLGRVRLGPDHRIFVLGWYHELHCLHALKFAAAHPEREEAKDDEHLHHCLNYLRQALLCEASGTLEKGDFLDRDFEHQPQGDIVICRDWERLFEVHAQNLREWVEWLHHWNR